MNTTNKEKKSYWPLAQFGEAVLDEDGSYYTVRINNAEIVGKWSAPAETFETWYSAQSRFKYCMPGDDWYDWQ